MGFILCIFGYKYMWHWSITCASKVVSLGHLVLFVRGRAGFPVFSLDSRELSLYLGFSREVMQYVGM